LAVDLVGGFSVDRITANCDGTGQVFFSGTIPASGRWPAARLYANDQESWK